MQSVLQRFCNHAYKIKHRMSPSPRQVLSRLLFAISLLNFFKNMCSCWSPPDAVYYMSQYISYPESSGSLVSGCRHQRPVKHVQTWLVPSRLSFNPSQSHHYRALDSKTRTTIKTTTRTKFCARAWISSSWRENLVAVFIVLRVLAGCRSVGNKLSHVRIVQIAYCRNPFYLPKSGRES